MDAREIQKLCENGIDYDTGLDRFAGNSELFEKFIRRFLEDTHYEELQKVLREGDWEEGFHVAHTLKGVVGNLSFSTYYETITPVAEALHQGDIDEAKKLMPLVDKAHRQVVQVLTELSA